MPFKYEINGSIYEFENEPTEADIDEVAKISSAEKAVVNNKSVDSKDTETIEKQGILGSTFNVPSAPAREAVRANPLLIGLGPLAGLAGLAGVGGKKAQQESINAIIKPSKSETFQDEAIRKAQDSVSEKWSHVTGIFAPTTKLGQFMMGAELMNVGHQASQLGYVADFATNPADVLLSLGDIVKAAKGILSPSKELKIDSKAIKLYKEALKPKLIGKNKEAIKLGNKKVSEALQSIVENEDNLKYFDDTTGLPTTLEKTIYAASETKEAIRQQYTNLRKMAGKDAKIDMRKVAEAVFESKSSKAAGIANPKLQEDAFQLASDLAKNGEIDLDTAEETIRILNKELEPLYKSGRGTGEEVVKAQLKATAANALRKEIDNVILNETGESYQLLKNRYGALSQMEEDAVKQLDRLQKVSPKKATAVLDTVPIIYGAFTGNVPLVSAGIGQKIIKRLLKPTTDELIRSSFSAIDKSRKVKGFLKGSTVVSGRKIIDSLNKK